ncbi:MAG: hypothetical protein JSS82_03545 [Bacteroidetes bacterium]|nr:hypothetical protein [Bacteroidota bacterium]
MQYVRSTERFPLVSFYLAGFAKSELISTIEPSVAERWQNTFALPYRVENGTINSDDELCILCMFSASGNDCIGRQMRRSNTATEKRTTAATVTVPVDQPGEMKAIDCIFTGPAGYIPRIGPHMLDIGPEIEIDNDKHIPTLTLRVDTWPCLPTVAHFQRGSK